MSDSKPPRTNLQEFMHTGLELAEAERAYRLKKSTAFLATPDVAGKPAPEAVRVNYSDQAACTERAARDRAQVFHEHARYAIELEIASARGEPK